MFNADPARLLPAIAGALLSAGALAGTASASGAGTRLVPPPAVAAAATTHLALPGPLAPATPAAVPQPAPAQPPGNPPAADRAVTPSAAALPGAPLPGAALPGAAAPGADPFTPPAGAPLVPPLAATSAPPSTPWPEAGPWPGPSRGGQAWPGQSWPLGSQYPDHRPSPSPSHYGGAGVTANRGPSEGPSQLTAPSGGRPLPASEAPAWQVASAPITPGPMAYLPAVLIAFGLFSLLVSGTGLVVVARLRRQW